MRILYVTLCVVFIGRLEAQVKLTLRTGPSVTKVPGGRLYIFTQSDTSKAVSYEPSPAQTAFAYTVTGLQGGMNIMLNTQTHHYPSSFSGFKPGYYKIAGLLDSDPSERGMFNPGNVFTGNNALLYINEKGEGEAELLFESVIPAKKFRENDTLKEVIFKSNLLSRFRKKDIFIKSAILLPPSYMTDASRHYPVVFIIPGWGGTHYDLQTPNPSRRYGMRMGKEKIYVYLNPEPQSPFGLHAFVDSRVNGPWGRALVEEFIPNLLRQYRISTDRSQHFIMGQSTGGYGSLWLQLNYPEAFGGCWSVSPDPVDFSNFVGVNLYGNNANFYTDPSGKLYPFFVINEKPTTTLKAFAESEAFLGDGEQIQAFEAEFGLPDKFGRPRQMFDRVTGKIHARAVKEWAPYDLGVFVRKNWKKYGAQLKGKVHVYAGSKDNFFLHKAVEAFAAKAAEAGADLKAEIVPGGDHWTIWTTEFTKRVQREIDTKITD